MKIQKKMLRLPVKVILALVVVKVIKTLISPYVSDYKNLFECINRSLGKYRGSENPWRK